MRAAGLVPSAVSGYECSSTRIHAQHLTWDAARERAHAAAAPLPPVLLPLAEATGAVLAAPLAAAGDLPALDRSAMDGYAVRGPGPWRVLGAVGAGVPAPPGLQAGEAWAVVTGSALPAGTDAVLPDEDAVRAGDRLTGAVASGRHVRRAGEECTAREELVPAGAVVRAPVLGLAAALG
jgi:molybdopterin molybdotransferase